MNTIQEREQILNDILVRLAGALHMTTADVSQFLSQSSYDINMYYALTRDKNQAEQWARPILAPRMGEYDFTKVEGFFPKDPIPSGACRCMNVAPEAKIVQDLVFGRAKAKVEGMHAYNPFDGYVKPILPSLTPPTASLQDLEGPDHIIPKKDYEKIDPLWDNPDTFLMGLRAKEKQEDREALLEAFKWAREHPEEAKRIREEACRKAEEFAKKCNDGLQRMIQEYFPGEKLEIVPNTAGISGVPGREDGFVLTLYKPWEYVDPQRYKRVYIL